ncbi:hypothetical protein BJ912DRAFT_958581 [Pholiota molesta]|nr:hypothetical protein BJ912DRAFT_958581 [Pholiota molesta]
MALLRIAPAVGPGVLIVALLVSSAFSPHSQLPGPVWRCRSYRSHHLAAIVWIIYLHIAPKSSLL